MSICSYQIVLMGAMDARAETFCRAVLDRVLELGIDPAGITFIKDRDFLATYERKMPAFGVYFGSAAPSIPIAFQQLRQDSIVVAPVVTSKRLVSVEIPTDLQHINALEVGSDGANIPRLVSLVLESFRLLRRERGIFISYRRKGSQPLANRLYEELDKRGFDVFIDVRSVPPAVDFQAELWHRMSDVDTIVLIDTPGFREGRWTKAELAQANLLGIQTLHLLWPGQTEDPTYAFSRYLKLAASDFANATPGRGASVKKSTVRKICELAEELRAEAIALRHAHLVDNFCDAARDLGIDPTVQPERWISVDLKNGKSLAVVPAVGRPTSDRINAIFDAISEHRIDGSPIWAIYDSRGLHENWVKHLTWLDGHLPIRTISVANVPDALKAISA